LSEWFCTSASNLKLHFHDQVAMTMLPQIAIGCLVGTVHRGGRNVKIVSY
jgi:hypothetical protein